MISEEELDNILVKQKDKILDYINYGKEQDIIRVAIQLNLVKELWDACGYTYKWHELNELMLAPAKTSNRESK